MDLKKTIKKWEKKSVEIYNEGTYKRMCHIDPKPWYNESETIDMVIADFRALAESSNESSGLNIADVSNRRELLLAFCDHLNTYDGMEEIRFDFMMQDYLDKSQ